MYVVWNKLSRLLSVNTKPILQMSSFIFFYPSGPVVSDVWAYDIKVQRHPSLRSSLAGLWKPTVEQSSLDIPFDNRGQKKKSAAVRTSRPSLQHTPASY